MAKKAILEVLESTIGRYVLNLDAESLNVAVWSGKIELQSLQLDVAAVNSELSRRAHEAPNLASPFRVSEGHFESVQLDVPWARLSSRPVVFRARGLWVHTEPHDFLKEDNSHAENRWGTRVRARKNDRSKSVVEERLNSIKRAEEARQRASAVRKAWEENDDANESSAGEGSDKGDSSSFTSRLVRRIIENLQVEVENVHIAVRGCGCAAGLVLGSLSLFTTDAKGNRSFVDRKTNAKDPSSSFLYKELVIAGLGIYLQNDAVNQDSMQLRSSKVTENAEYVLSPLSFQAKLRQSDLDRCVDFPKYLIHSKLSSLSIQLSRNQLDLGQRLALAVAPNAETRPLFPEYRPLEPILGNAKQWWRYAVRCIGRLNRQRSWIEFYIALRKRKSYVELYKRHSHAEGAPWLSRLSVSEQAELGQIENDRSISVAGLMHWRTIADAQVGKEREKRSAAALSKQNESSGVGGSTVSKRKSSIKSSFASSLFGNTHRRESSDSFYECLDEQNDAPITLTVSEMKELEELAMKKANRSLTEDSMLCDVIFLLGSFQVILLNAPNQPLTSLEMGMVSASFKACANGSFACGLSLLSMEITDGVTPNTFYPTICRSLQKAHSNKSHAFEFQLRKSKDGDQELVLKMVACEIIASPMLLFSIKEFFKLPEAQSSGSRSSHPMLYASVDGDEDLFFDAKEGMSTMLLSPMSVTSTPKATQVSTSTQSRAGYNGTSLTDGKVSGKLSSAIMDAWNGKNQQKQQWKMNFDISAPILILPENCTDPDATVLICNFGRFKFTYGQESHSPPILEWFDSRRRALMVESEIDHLNLEMNDLSFTISSVSEASKKRLDEMELDVSTSVIEPISFTLDVGLEHSISSGASGTPRTCVIGVLPGIVLRLAPSHVSKILRVTAIWASNLHKLRAVAQGDSTEDEGEGVTLLSEVEEESSHDHELEALSSGSGISMLDKDATTVSGGGSLLSKKERLESMLFSRQNSDGSNVEEFMHINVSLLKLSINMYTDHGDGLEAHLVSVVASSSLATDGTSSSRLSMGWFWILDRLASEEQWPRRQRLVCHSNLPRSATEYAEHDRYAIMDDLIDQGVFEPSYAGSADLADINIIKLPPNKARAYHEQTRDFSPGYMQSISNVDRTTVMRGKFSSLFLNWNPQAIKTLFAAKSNLLDFKEKAYSTYERMSMLQQQGHRPNFNEKLNDKPNVAPVDVGSSGGHSIFVLAEMDTFEITLHSARDDLPLFTLTMKSAKVNHHSLEDDDVNSEMSLVIGDFRMETAALGRTLESYRTILGLAPSASTSLLTVKYSKGVAVRSCNVGGADKLNCEACAEIVLSPMRFVHIHSQVFTLIEYVTDGVFGAIAASVASSAAAAAIEAATQDGERLFYVVATGFNLVVPQSAYSTSFFSFLSGNFEAHYRTLESDIGSEAFVSLKDVSMNCDRNMHMVDTPVNVSVSVKLKPPLSKGTEDEKATRVEVSISRICLLIARCHYAQVMHTLDYNIGEEDNFLRGKKVRRKDTGEDGKQPGKAVSSIMSHAGVEEFNVIKRMYISFKIEELSVELCGDTTADSIMSLAAVEAHILMKLLPDKKQTKAFVTLHDLVCDDRRVVSADRTFRRMIGRGRCVGDNKSEVFLLNYTKHAEDDSRDIEVKIGSSQVVVLPDVITEMINWIKVAPYPYRSIRSSLSLQDVSNQSDGTSVQVVVTDYDPEEVEACFEPTPKHDPLALKKTNYHIESSNMRLVLVDMGSIDSPGSSLFVPNTKAVLTDTIVLQGKMQAQFEMTSERASDTTVEKDYKLHAERVEVYTSQGAELLHPVQILEPAKFSIFYYQKAGSKSEPNLTDVKFVTLSPIDLTVSMQNAALASTLASSISESFSSDKDVNDDGNKFHSLSANEAKRIARLDSALEKDADESTQCQSEHPSDLSMHAGKHLQTTRRIRIKMTSPEATLTVTNDFQGLDEALFKIVAMNCVFGGEVNYISARETPCFGCNINCSILADYFDAATNRWQELLTSPWELTFNASRAPETKLQSKRMSTTFDIESSQCHVSFSEHFIVNLGAASRMWSVYSGATKQAAQLVEESDSFQRRSMAAHAARSLITTLPYAIENHSGLRASYSIYDNPMMFPLPTSSTQFFRFEPFPERGSGGMRLYGQDCKHSKAMTLYVGSTEIKIQDMDSEVNEPRSAHFIPDFHIFVFINVVKRGKSTVLHLSSHVELHNSSSSLDFRISVIGDERVHDLGVVKKTKRRKGSASDSLLKESEDLMTHAVFGLPAPLLRGFAGDTSETLCIQISPVSGLQSKGMFNLPPLQSLVEIATSDESRRIMEVSCSPVSRENRSSSLSVNICLAATLVGDSHPFVELFIEPRLILKNRLPISIILRTPMPHTFISTESSQPEHSSDDFEDANYTTHRLKSLDSIEIFTPGPSIAISIRCSELPIGGTPTGWIDGNFIDVPLKGKILEPISTLFPFQMKSLGHYDPLHQLSGQSRGNSIYVLEADDVTPDLNEIGNTNHNRAALGSMRTSTNTSMRTVVFIVCNYAVDHTGNLLFEQVSLKSDLTSRRDPKSINSAPLIGSPPYSAFSSAHHRRRVSLLPDSNSYIRLVQLTIDGEEGMRRSMPFRIEDCSMTEGIDSMPILWDDTTPSGFFAYRHLTAEGSELHVTPEFVIFNGSEVAIWVKQLARPPFLLDPSKICPISRDRNNSIVVQFSVPTIDGLTGPVQIDKIGLRICVAKSKVSGEPLGSFAVQTVTGARDSRMVIKIGALDFEGSDELGHSGGLFTHDFIRFRVRWTEMRVTLRDTGEDNEKYEENRTAIRKYLEHHNVNSAELEKKLVEARRSYNREVSKKRKSRNFPEVAQILLHRFTVDFQRIFKKEEEQKVKGMGGFHSGERAQFSVVVHNVRITDLSPNTESSIVFDSMTDKSFFDLCVRTRGPLDADLIRVDLFDLNLAYGEGKAEKIVVNTGEDFVWRLLDIANRTMVATSDLAGVDIDLKWDDKAGKFLVAISDPRLEDADDLDSDGNYNPPRSDKLYDVKMLRVSPFILLLSFKRQPHSSRYKLTRGVRGAKLTNYFTTRLKFTIDRADLRFQGYMVRNIKGPPDRLADTIKAVYTTQLKSKMVTLMTATSFQDWKYLTARDSGGEEFIEGDLLRMTGNLAGRSAKFVLKKSGDYIGDSLVAVTGTIGGGIQEATESVGLGQVGAGVNSIVSGLGEGVSSGVKGVGTGAGDILRGAGKGIGQVVGGFGGGVQIVGKGIAKGVTTGDGKQLVSEVGTGFATMGSGIGQGFETAVEGTVSGVFSVGKGLFSGAKSVGRGIGGVFNQNDESERKSMARGHRK